MATVSGENGTSGPRVAIALATFDGARFLREQIASFRCDVAAAIDLWVSDDGSRDETPAMLKDAARLWTRGQVRILPGPRRGFAENFRSLMANPALDADYVAFADQDDVWHARKLPAALAALGGEPGPAMFCSRTRGVDGNGRSLGLSPRIARPPDFRNALVENIASGNTMVFNRAAWELLRISASRSTFVYHDWWAYIIVTGAGGRVHHSDEPLVDYRQHGGNAIGLGNSLARRVRRIGVLLSGGVARNNAAHIAALCANADLLTPAARETLARFERAHNAGFPASLRHLRRSGVFRQTLYGQAGLWVAGALGRL
jgi:glycosyltransferase involved in cell wall biosynthesis